MCLFMKFKGEKGGRERERRWRIMWNTKNGTKDLYSILIYTIFKSWSVTFIIVILLREKEVLIELESIGEIRWYAYQKLTNDMNISSHVQWSIDYICFFKESQDYIPICAYGYQKSSMVQNFGKICDVLSASCHVLA